MYTHTQIVSSINLQGIYMNTVEPRKTWKLSFKKGHKLKQVNKFLLNKSSVNRSFTVHVLLCTYMYMY